MLVVPGEEVLLLGLPRKASRKGPWSTYRSGLSRGGAVAIARSWREMQGWWCVSGIQLYDVGRVTKGEGGAVNAEWFQEVREENGKWRSDRSSDVCD